MSILITGGAGYIGSHVSKQLLEKNEEIIILDNLSTGSQVTLDALSNINKYKFIKCDLKDFDKVKEVFEQNDIDTIIHFAASIIVPESVEDPLKYYMNNTVNTTNLISIANEFGVKKFIFSSTAAVYGEPSYLPDNGIDEDYETKPINPYGMSKLMSESIIQDTAKANENFKFVIFRYFNVAGADINYTDTNLVPRIGQSFPKATNLIKVVSEVAASKREKLYVFGTDYDTFDGTGIRDYIHVDDLASAHIRAIEYLENSESEIFNAGYGHGYSVKEVIDTMQKTIANDLNVEYTKRRKGDPANVISNNNKILNKLNWIPKFDNLELICQSSYEWEKRL